MDDLFYVHERLGDAQDEIRVLSLLRAPNHDDVLHGELRTDWAPSEINDDDIGEYEALSYAWGDTTFTHGLWINGRRLALTANLDTALRHLRYPDRERSLWIDGICIDQANHEEKSVQVQMLRRTFNHARQMLIWLGPGDEKTDYGMCCLNQHNDYLLLEDDSPTSLYGLAGGDKTVFHLALQEIFARPWWSRLWTSVEVLFFGRAPLVGCGRYWATWTTIIHNGVACGVPRRVFSATFLNEPTSETSWERKEWLLSPLLEYLSDCKVTDPRDHVFAIAGMFPRLMRELKLPDYSLPVSVVFQRTTIALMVTELTRRDQSQSRSYVRGSRRLAVPSWCVDFSVPDWISDQRETYSVGTRCMTDGETYSARPTYMTPLPLEHDLTKGLLMLDGVEVDRIQSVLNLPRTSTIEFRALANCSDSLDTFTLRAQIQRAEKTFQDWIQLILPSRGRIMDRLQRRLGKEITSHTFAQGTFWETLAGGWGPIDLLGMATRAIFHETGFERALTREEERRRAGDSMAFEYTDYVELERHFTDALFAATGTKAKLAADCVDRLSDVDLRALAVIAVNMEGSALFLTEHGHFGRCPDKVREGDVLAVLSRSIFPAVFRSNEDETWEHVAHAYVHGIVTGAEAEELATLKRKKFWLR